MSKILDWDAFALIYAANLSSTMGAKGIDARIIIGSLIIKHLERKDDRGTIQMIQENPYMQYFLGFDHFSSEPIFIDLLESENISPHYPCSKVTQAPLYSSNLT